MPITERNKRMISLMLTYHEQHGDYNVPLRHPDEDLGRWANKLRFNVRHGKGFPRIAEILKHLNGYTSIVNQKELLPIQSQYLAETRRTHVGKSLGLLLKQINMTPVEFAMKLQVGEGVVAGCINATEYVSEDFINVVGSIFSVTKSQMERPEQIELLIHTGSLASPRFEKSRPTSIVRDSQNPLFSLHHRAQWSSGAKPEMMRSRAY